MLDSAGVRTASGSDRIKTQLNQAMTSVVFKMYRLIRSLPLAVLTRTPSPLLQSSGSYISRGVKYVIAVETVTGSISGAQSPGWSPVWMRRRTSR